MENCLVRCSDSGSEIHSTIVGFYQGKIYNVNYKIITNENWETTYVEVHSRHSNRIEKLIFLGDGKGNWTMNGLRAEKFNGCIDIDIPLTPFTNTLPINRLKLEPNNERQISVVYIDLLEQKTVPVKQKYVCLSKTEYHYENIPNDFEATIEVDDQGFVVDYPALFLRTAKIKTEYPHNIFK